MDSGSTNKTRLLLFHAHMEFFCVVTDKQYSEAIFLAKIMAKMWHKVQENGTKNIRLAKVVAKEKKILAQTLHLLIFMNGYIANSKFWLMKTYVSF